MVVPKRNTSYEDFLIYPPNSIRIEEDRTSCNWILLREFSQLMDLKVVSKSKSVILFKHSTRCSTSRYMLDKFKNEPCKIGKTVVFYYLDVVKNKALSSEIAKLFDIPHESPQVLVLNKGEVVYCASHFDIDLLKIKKRILP